MKHPVIGGLTLAVSLAAFGAHAPVRAQDSAYFASIQTRPLIAYPGIAERSPLLANLNYSPETHRQARANSLIAPSPSQSVTTASQYSLATVHSHALDNRLAATVYIKAIPVITLVGNKLSASGAAKSDSGIVPADSNGAQALVNPVERANLLASRLQALAGSLSASDISVRWDNRQQAFVVSWGKEDLIKLDHQAILPDTTENKAEDALQVTNRLRRLLGNVPALTRVNGLPEPEGVSTTRTGVIRSRLTGMASWYGPGFHGQRSANGEIFNQNALTAAHRTLPFGTRVRVTNLNTGQQVIVRINDRGPFSHGRIIDLSTAAASSIGIRSAGVGRVALEVLGQ